MGLVSVLLLGAGGSFASEPHLEQHTGVVAQRADDYALTSLLYWKHHLAVLAEDQELMLEGPVANAVYLRLKGIEDDLLVHRRVNTLEDWESLREMVVKLHEHKVLEWYYEYYYGLHLFAAGRFKESKVALGKSKSLAEGLVAPKYQRSSLLALYEVNLCDNSPFAAVQYFREFYQIMEVQYKADDSAARSGQQAYAVNKASGSKWLKWWFALLAFVGLAAWAWMKWFRYRLVLVAEDNRSLNESFMANFTANPNSENAATAERSADDALTDEEILVDEQKVELLAEIRGKKILTEDDWFAFQQLFVQVHPDFLVHLRFRHKQVTPSEEKLACLIRLHFSTKEIARLLAISTHAVNVGRYRLKKRFQLDGSITLQEYLMGF